MADEAPPIGRPGFNLYADQGKRLIAANIALITLPIICVILRFASRKIARAGYWWDDLFVLLALILATGLPICNLISVHHGFGKHIWILPRDTTPIFLHILYVFEILFYLNAFCIKMSILAFYRRIFPIAQLKTVLLITTAVVLCFSFTCLMIVTFQCVPIHAFWDLEYRMTARCVNVDDMFLISGSVNCFLDVFLVAMPIPLLWRLKTTKSQKLILTSIFAVAGFVCLVSIIRLIVLSRIAEVDLTWNYVNAGIWTATEPSMGVVSACLPSLRPLFKRIYSGDYHGPTLRSRTGKSAQDSNSGVSTKHIWSRTKRDSPGVRSFTRLEEPNHEPSRLWGHNAQVQGGRKPGSMAEDQISLEEMQIPLDRIKVMTEVTLISTERIEYRDQLF